LANDVTATNVPPPRARQRGISAATRLVKPINSISMTARQSGEAMSATNGCSIAAPLATATAPRSGMSSSRAANAVISVRSTVRAVALGTAAATASAFARLER